MVRWQFLGTHTVSMGEHISAALYPDRRQIGMRTISVSGFLKKLRSSKRLKISNSNGAAAPIPVSPGRPSPSALPTQTATTYLGVRPIAQPSRLPKLVPVFQAILCDDENKAQAASSSGRATSTIASKVCHIAPAEK